MIDPKHADTVDQLPFEDSGQPQTGADDGAASGRRGGATDSAGDTELQLNIADPAVYSEVTRRSHAKARRNGAKLQTADIEDGVQNACLKICEGDARIDSPAYATSVAINSSRDEKRAWGSRMHSLEAGPSDTGLPESEARSERFLRVGNQVIGKRPDTAADASLLEMEATRIFVRELASAILALRPWYRSALLSRLRYEMRGSAASWLAFCDYLGADPGSIEESPRALRDAVSMTIQGSLDPWKAFCAYFQIDPESPPPHAQEVFDHLTSPTDEVPDKPAMGAVDAWATRGKKEVERRLLAAGIDPSRVRISLGS